MPQLSDWPRYDEANDVFTLLGDLLTDSLLDLTKAEARALAIANLYCDVKKEVRGKAIPNHKKMSLCSAEWRKEPIKANRLTARSRAAYRWLLERITQRMLAIFSGILLYLLAIVRIASILLPLMSCCMSMGLKLLLGRPCIQGRPTVIPTSPSDSIG